MPVEETSISSELRKLGFQPGRILETILCTRNSDASINVAPMGVRLSGEDSMIIRPYNTTNTCINLSSRRDACINITSDPELFLYSAFKSEEDWLTRIVTSDDMTLLGSEATAYVKISEEDHTETERPSFSGRVTFVKVLTNYPSAFSRGRSLAIEAVIISTHIQFFIRNGQLEASNKLIQCLMKMDEKIRKVSPPESPEVNVSSKLNRLVLQWRNSI